MSVAVFRLCPILSHPVMPSCCSDKPHPECGLFPECSEEPIPAVGLRGADPLPFLPDIPDDLLRRHARMQDDLCAAFIEETRGGPWSLAYFRQGAPPNSREWVESIGGPWRRRFARLRLLLSPKMRKHIQCRAAWFKAICGDLPASRTALIMEAGAPGELMRARYEPRAESGGEGDGKP